ncbi:MAG: peptidoglycan DD-metalloendopeptidase family protein [Bacteroidales bacterium]|nr:peptidoglycan DD-metalloendopeptidase family protein [Bacteroidales bacterium]
MIKRIHITLALAAALIACCLPAHAQTQQQLNERDRLEREIAILDDQIKANASQSANALSQLNLVQSKITARQALVTASNREISTINVNLNAKQKQIDQQQQQLDTMTVYYARLVKSAYKNRDSRLWYMYILASDNLGQASRRYGFLRNLSSRMNDQAERIKAAKAELEKQRAQLVEMRSAAQKLRDQRVLELDALRKEEAQAKDISTRLQRERTRYQRELTQKRREAQALEAEIKKAIAAAMKGTSKSPAPEIDYALSEEFVSNRGKLPWPADGPVVAKFGKQYHPVYKNLQLPDNNGVSLAVSPNSQVRAIFDGTVRQIAIFPGYHQCVLVQHGNYFTLYCNMKSVNVKAGDKVSTSQVLGTVDTINGETVFHFEIWNEKTVPQNPESWLRPR